jgi:hypothetical protein
MIPKSATTVVLVLVGGAAAYWLYRSLQTGNSPATARGVTDTTKGSIVSTPVSLGRVAAVAIGDPLKWIGSVTNRAAQLIPSNLSNGSAATNWRIPFGNPESQAAASSAVKATNVSNYRPTSWAPMNFRRGV